MPGPQRLWWIICLIYKSHAGEYRESRQDMYKSRLCKAEYLFHAGRSDPAKLTDSFSRKHILTLSGCLADHEDGEKYEHCLRILGLAQRHHIVVTKDTLWAKLLASVVLATAEESKSEAFEALQQGYLAITRQQ
jgi:hypothetical protein